jgi:hypothetical protein
VLERGRHQGDDPVEEHRDVAGGPHVSDRRGRR